MNAIAWALLASASLSQPGERTVSELTYPSVDGLEVRAVLSMPPGSGPFPLVVTVHGGNSEKSYGYLRTMAAPNRVSSIVNDLNKQPWAILAVSYRNGFMNLGDDDVMAGVRFGMALPRIDKSKVGLLGGSHGGYKVLQAAVRMGDEIKCVGAGSPFMVDPVALMTGDPSKPPISLVDEQVRRRVMAQAGALYSQVLRREGSEEQALAFLKRHSAFERSAEIKVPLLLMTSLSDESVPHAFVEPLYKKMKESGQQVEMHTVKNSPHGFYWGRVESARARQIGSDAKAMNEEEVRLTSERITAFFSRHFAG